MERTPRPILSCHGVAGPPAGLVRRSIALRLAPYIGVLAFVFAVVGSQWASAKGSSPSVRPMDNLRRAAQNLSAAATEQNAQEIAAAITHASIGLRWLGVDPESAAVITFRDSLSARHLDWQSSRASGISEERLLIALNDELELTALPSHLQLRFQDLRKARVNLWLNAPELTTGVAREDAVAGTPIFTDTLSPFEALVVVEWVLYSKLFDPAYVLTDAEQYQAIRTPSRREDLSSPRVRGLVLAPPNPRGDELQEHLGRVTRKRWRSIHGTLATVSELLEAANAR
jgi:hypothetical protein